MNDLSARVKLMGNMQAAIEKLVRRKANKRPSECRYMVYGRGNGQGSSIDLVIYDIKNETSLYTSRYTSLKDVFERLTEGSRGAFSKKDLVLEYYTYDERIQKSVYMICIKRFRDKDYIKEYGHTIYFGYLIDLNEEKEGRDDL
jgi:hypothetical protein